MPGFGETNQFELRERFRLCGVPCGIPMGDGCTKGLGLIRCKERAHMNVVRESLADRFDEKRA